MYAVARVRGKGKGHVVYYIIIHNYERNWEGVTRLPTPIVVGSRYSTSQTMAQLVISMNR